MPNIEWNKAIWNRDYDWTQDGDEWSSAWGSTDMYWYATILPRIHQFVPTSSILEIGPGFGRWTQFLKGLCQELTVIDLSEKCIDACRKRFQGANHIRYHVNDGTSLEMIPDESIDFVFTFDSLVHAERDVIESYLVQLAKKLKRNGVGVIHHSNLGEYKAYFSLLRRLKILTKATVFSGHGNGSTTCPTNLGHRRARTLSNALVRIGLLEEGGNRALSMTAAEFQKLATNAGLRCIAQELVPWDGKRLIDSISTFTRPESRWCRENRCIRNPGFRLEANGARTIAGIYGNGSFPVANGSDWNNSAH